MTILNLFVLGVLVSTPAPETCEVDRHGYCTQKVVRKNIYYDTAKNNVPITISLGEATTVRLPRNTFLEGNPAVGNAGLVNVSVFQVEGTERVTINPRMPRAAQQEGRSARSLYGQKTNILLLLKGRLSVSISVRFGPKEKAVQFVELTFPEREKESLYVQEKLAEAQRQLSQEHATKLARLRSDAEALAQEILARNMLKGMHCTEVDDLEMSDGIVFGVEDICAVGDQIFIRVRLKNRNRDDAFRVERIEVSGVAGGEFATSVVWDQPGDALLLFDDRRQGVVSFLLEEGEASAGYTVRVVEAAGAKRSVSVEGVGF